MAASFTVEYDLAMKTQEQIL